MNQYFAGSDLTALSLKEYWDDDAKKSSLPNKLH